MLNELIELITANPEPFGIGVLVVVVVIAVLGLRKPERDPKRLFSSSERAEGNARAGGRCEMVRLFRCKRPAQHGDHWIPWSKGGATSLDNYVALCAPCNLRKSAHMPSRFKTWRLYRSRHGYMVRPLRPGEHYRH